MDAKTERMPGARRTVKDLLMALSLANLCFIAAWTDLLTKSDHLGVRYSVYTFNRYVAISINVLLLAAFFWGATALIRRSGSALLMKAGRASLLILLLFCLNRVIYRPLPGFSVEGMLDLFNRVELAIFAAAAIALCFAAMRKWRHTSTLAGGLVPFALIGKASLVGVALVTVAVYWIARKPRAIVGAAPVAVMALFPFTLMTLFQTSSTLMKFGEKRPAAPVSKIDGRSRRVIWLLFDEFDYRLSFVERPASLSLPEFDRLRAEAVFATQAYPPSDRTLMSIPAMITGKLLSGAEPVEPSKVLITYADSGETVDWGAQPNLFSRAREREFDSAIVGWYHPYDRLIGDSVTKCSGENIGTIGVAEAMSDQARQLGDIIPFASHYELFDGKDEQKTRERRGHLRDYLGVIEEAKMRVVDADVNLVFVHLPVPHAPSIYDRRTGSFETESETGYIDSLALADRALGELRRTMEAAGMWDSSTLLITSDHWWRFYESDRKADVEYATSLDKRVPFLIKLAGQREAVSYDAEFNNVILHDLILEALGTGLSDTSRLVQWMDHNRSTARPFMTNDRDAH